MNEWQNPVDAQGPARNHCGALPLLISPSIEWLAHVDQEFTLSHNQEPTLDAGLLLQDVVEKQCFDTQRATVPSLALPPG